MTNEFENMPTAPTLTLDPFQEEKQAPKPVEKQDPVMDDAILTPEEKQTVMQFAQQIDLTNSQMILQYGAGTQKKMADFPRTRWKMYGRKIWVRSGTSDGRCKRTQRF